MLNFTSFVFHHVNNVYCCLQGISFEEFRSFFQFLNNLEDFAIAMQMYNFANRSIGQGKVSQCAVTSFKLSQGFSELLQLKTQGPPSRIRDITYFYWCRVVSHITTLFHKLIQLFHCI